MILLIQEGDNTIEITEGLFKFHYDSINSVCPQNVCTVNVTLFKFHYDSINSEHEYMGIANGNGFKFHYDSINSYTWFRVLQLCHNHLNSIMILLIRGSNREMTSRVK